MVIHDTNNIQYILVNEDEIVPSLLRALGGCTSAVLGKTNNTHYYITSHDNIISTLPVFLVSDGLAVNLTLYLAMLLVVVEVVLIVGELDVDSAVVVTSGELALAVLSIAFVAFVVGSLTAVPGLVSVTESVLAFVDGTAVVLFIGVSWGWVLLAVLSFTAEENMIGFMVVGTVVGLPVGSVVLVVVTTLV